MTTAMNTARRFGWAVMKAQKSAEEERLDFLRTGQLPKNDPKLLKPTRVKVLKPFMVNGTPAQVGEIVTLEAHTAKGLIGLKKAELIS